MTDDSADLGGPAAAAIQVPGRPSPVDRTTFHAELERLRAREKEHTLEGDAIAAARRRLPMAKVDADVALTGADGSLTLLQAFEGRRQLIAYYFMWHTRHSAADQCEGCTFYTAQVAELSHRHSRDITYAVFCQGPPTTRAPATASSGWDMPWYSAEGSLWPRLESGGSDDLATAGPSPESDRRH